MSAVRDHLQPVDVGALEDYPVDPAARLDSHSYLQWEFKRWISSDMRWQGDHACKSMWFELVNLAHEQTPVGTLPNDLRRLARMIQPAVDPDQFEQLCQLKFGPLHGWRLCRVGDDVRLMHDTVTRIVVAAFASRANLEAKNEVRSLQARLRRLSEDVAQVAPQLAQNGLCIRFIHDWVEEAVKRRGGERRTKDDLHHAIQICFEQKRAGRFEKKG